MVRDVSFDLHRGEILGLGGLVGAGRSETVETIFGLRPRAGGEVRYRGQAVRAALASRGDPRRHRLRRRGSAPPVHRARPLRAREPAARPSRRASRLRPRLWQAGQEDRRADGAARTAGRPARRAEPAELLRRHAAEDHHRALAAAGAEGADPRRADQGRRHRHARLDLRDPARHRRDRRGDPHRFLGIRGAARACRARDRDQRRGLDRRRARAPISTRRS